MDAWRVVQLVVERGAGREAACGSGFLTARGRVLTAAHVLEGASAIQVRLDVGQETEINLPAISWWADPAAHEASDLAVVMIPEDATAPRTVERALFGRIGDEAAVLNVAAFGFPLFKARSSLPESGQVKVFRDFEQATGHAPAAANRRQGTLAFYLDDPPPGQTPDEKPSPWEGMSGGPVLVGDRIVGVVAEHHASEGPGRLTVRRIDRAYEQLSPFQLTELIELLGLPPSADVLPDVVPRSPGELARSVYVAQVSDIAPDRLIGRDDELAAWAGFCTGGESFAWWQGDPWAGKTALASWFVLHPPPDVDVVSFFVTGRLIGQADSEAFLLAMGEQLNSLYPAIGRPVSAAAGARTGQWLGLVAAAGAEAESRGRRLVVVVDGLDEDEAGAIPSRGFPSIASLLPRRPPSGVRFIITSRPNPGLPDDLPADHPLRACAIYQLPVSAVAKAAEFSAKQELRELLGGDQVAVDVVGYIAGSGGGLTRTDLSTLTGAPPYRLEPVLRGVSGRSLSTRSATDPRDLHQYAAARVYLFAHDTLQNLAQEQLGDELAVYRERVCGWIASYAEAGWPGTTPGYAVRGYPRLLTAVGDARRLSALARDPARHQLLSQATGSDYAAVTDLEAAQSLVASEEDLDLGALVELAAYRWALLARNEWIPGELPLLWARLDRFDHAEALARTLPDPAERTRALAKLAAAAARSGELGKAETIAGAIGEPIARAYALSNLMIAAAKAGDLDRSRRLAADAKAAGRSGSGLGQDEFFVRLVSAMAEAGDVDGAEALAHATNGLFMRSEKFAGLVTAVALGGDLDRAEVIARALTNDFDRDLVLTKLVAAVVKAGDLDRAAAIASTLTRHHHRAEALISLLPAVAEAGDPDRWQRIADDAVALAAQLANHEQRDLAALGVALARAGDLERAEAVAAANPDGSDPEEIRTALVAAAAQAGDLDRAEAIARAALDEMSQAELLISLIPAAVQAGHYDRASKIAIDVEALADEYADVDPRYVDYVKARVLAKLASAAVQAGDLDRAQTLVQSITHWDDKAKLLPRLVDAAVAAGELDRAQALVRTLTNSEGRAAALVGFMAAMHADDLNQAETLVRTVVDPADQAGSLSSLIAALIQAGDLGRAEALADTLADPDDKAEALAKLADAAMEAGDIDRAYRLTTSTETAARVTDSVDQDEVLLGLVTAARQAGDLNRAEALIRTLKHPAERDSASIDLAVTIAATGDLDRAEALTRILGSHFAQSQALSAVASAAVRAGNLDCARRLAADAADIARTINQPAVQSRVLADVALTVARAGDLDEAETILRSVTAGNEQAKAIIGLIGLIAGAGDIPRVNSLLGLVRSQDDQAKALTAVARAATRTGNQDLARTVADLAERKFLTVCDFDHHADVLAVFIAAMAWAGNLDRAEELTRIVLLDSTLQNQALAQMVTAATHNGDIDRAAVLALSMTDPLDQADTLISLASLVGRAGDLDRAESLIWIISRPCREDGTPVGMFASPIYKAKALTSLVLAAGQAGDMNRVRRLATEAETVIGGLRYPDQPWPELLRLADALGEAGDFGYSARLLAKILNADWPETGWIKTVAQFFPSAVGRAWEILSGAC